MIDLKGLQYPFFAGLGAILALIFVSPVLAIIAIWFPALWPWVLSPAAVGAVIGLILGVFVK